MADNTDRLREIFLDVTEEESVTETQEEQRTHSPAGDPRERVRETVSDILSEADAGTQFDEDELTTIVIEYFNGESDTGIARKLGSESLDKSVARARHALHLFRESDIDAPFDVDEYRSLPEDISQKEAASRLGVSASTLRHYSKVFDYYDAAQSASQSHRDRLQDAFEGRDEVDIDIYDGLSEALDGVESKPR